MEGFSRSNRDGSFVQGGAVGENASRVPRSTRVSARSKTARAESLKSSLAGSTTAKYKLGFRNWSKELLSRITGGNAPQYETTCACSSAALSSGSPSARKPCLVRNQN